MEAGTRGREAARAGTKKHFPPTAAQENDR